MRVDDSPPSHPSHPLSSRGKCALIILFAPQSTFPVPVVVRSSSFLWHTLTIPPPPPVLWTRSEVLCGSLSGLPSPLSCLVSPGKGFGPSNLLAQSCGCTLPEDQPPPASRGSILTSSAGSYAHPPGLRSLRMDDQPLQSHWFMEGRMSSPEGERMDPRKGRRAGKRRRVCTHSLVCI